MRQNDLAIEERWLARGEWAGPAWGLDSGVLSLRAAVQYDETRDDDAVRTNRRIEIHTGTGRVRFARAAACVFTMAVACHPAPARGNGF